MKDGSLPSANTERSRSPGASRFAWVLLPPVQIGIILLLGMGLYLNTLNAPFIFDDYPCILENPAITSLDYFFDYEKVRELTIDVDIKNNFALRPVVYLTFALNYLVGGTRVFGFHLVNTIIHLINALLIYALVALTLQRAPLHEDRSEAMQLDQILPLLVALLFVAHPIQTQAVTYITQRFTSLAVLFYLTALYCYICARTAEISISRWVYYGISLLMTYVAMKTKAIAFTLPVILLLYDLFFLSGTRRQRLLWLLPYFLSMLIIPGTLIWLVATDGVDDPRWKIEQSINLVNFSNVSRWDYLKTQFGVIVSYLRMFFFPVGQNLDHDVRLAHSFFETKIIASFLLLITLFGVAVRLALRDFQSGKRTERRLIAFGILWFFITISMSSSIIPIDDLMVEYRNYLPSFGLFFAVAVTAVVAVNRGLVRRSVFCYTAVLVVVICAVATYARNSLYRDPVRMFHDVISKSPDKPRVHDLLRSSYLANGRFDEAIIEFTKMFERYPHDSGYPAALGYIHLVRGQFDDALRQLHRAIAISPSNFYAHGNLGLVYLYTGRQMEAEHEFLQTLQLKPDFNAVRLELGHLYEQQGRKSEAITQYEILLRYYPENRESAVRLQQLRITNRSRGK